MRPFILDIVFLGLPIKNIQKETYKIVSKLANILVSVSYQQMKDARGHVQLQKPGCSLAVDNCKKNLKGHTTHDQVVTKLVCAMTRFKK